MKRKREIRLTGASIAVSLFNLIGLSMYFIRNNIYNILPLAYLLELIIAFYILSIVCILLWASGGERCRQRTTVALFYIIGNMMFAATVISLLHPITARLGLAVCIVMLLMLVTSAAMSVSIFLGIIMDIISTLMRRKKRGVKYARH